MSYKYKSKVMNRNGRTVLLPNVGSAAELLNSTTVDPYAAPTVAQEFPLGTKLIEGERVWRYTRNGAGTLTVGMVLQMAVAAHGDADDDIASATINAVAATTAYITGATNIACAANFYKEGYLYVNHNAGQGVAYKIKSHIAIVNAVETPIVLYDPILVATTAASQYGIKKNPYDYVVAAAGTASAVGVAIQPVTAAYYFWMATGGPCAVNPKTAMAINLMVVGGVTSGQADDYTPVTTVPTAAQLIGYPMTPAIADGEHFLCFLTLDR